MSAPEVTLAGCAADVVELAARRGTATTPEAALAAVASLPPCGRFRRHGRGLALSCRPGRWLLLDAPGVPGSAACGWRAACGEHAAVIELSSALRALYLEGAAAREMLARGCRLDLDPALFPVGAAAATIIAQVSTILAALPSGILILTPASTAQHLEEWLAAAARPFGFAPRAELAITALSGELRP